VNYVLWAGVYKTFRVLKVGHVCIVLRRLDGHVCIVLQRLQWAFSSVLLVVGNINHTLCYV